MVGAVLHSHGFIIFYHIIHIFYYIIHYSVCNSIPFEFGPTLRFSECILQSPVSRVPRWPDGKQKRTPTTKRSSSSSSSSSLSQTVRKCKGHGVRDQIAVSLGSRRGPKANNFIFRFTQNDSSFSPPPASLVRSRVRKSLLWEKAVTTELFAMMGIWSDFAPKVKPWWNWCTVDGFIESCGLHVEFWPLTICYASLLFEAAITVPWHRTKWSLNPFVGS